MLSRMDCRSLLVDEEPNLMVGGRIDRIATTMAADR